METVEKYQFNIIMLLAKSQRGFLFDKKNSNEIPYFGENEDYFSA